MSITMKSNIFLLTTWFILNYVNAFPSGLESTLVNHNGQGVRECDAFDQQLSNQITLNGEGLGVGGTAFVNLRDNDKDILSQSIHQYLVSQLRYINKKLNDSVRTEKSHSLENLADKLADPLSIDNFTDSRYISFVGLKLCGMKKATLKTQLSNDHDMQKCRTELKFEAAALRISGTYIMPNDQSAESSSRLFVIDLNNVTMNQYDESAICYAPEFNKTSSSPIELQDLMDISYGKSIIHYSSLHDITSTDSFRRMIYDVLRFHLLSEVFRTLQPISQKHLLDTMIQNVITRSILEFQKHIENNESYSNFTMENREKKLEVAKNAGELFSIQNVHLSGLNKFNITKLEVRVLENDTITVNLMAHNKDVKGLAELIIFSPDAPKNEDFLFEVGYIGIKIFFHIVPQQYKDPMVNVCLNISSIDTFNPLYPNTNPSRSMPSFLFIKSMELFLDQITSVVKSYILNIFQDADKLSTQSR